MSDLVDAISDAYESAPYVTSPSGFDLRGELPLLQHDDQFMYNMNSKRRGIFLLINNKTFHENTGQKERSGSDVDAENLKTRFKALGFEVESGDNQTCRQMMENMRKAGRYDHSNSDCFVCAILSHGNADGDVYGTDGIIRLNDLVEPIKNYNCPSLVGKPKIFIIQACRGYTFDDGVTMVKTDPQGPNTNLLECRGDDNCVEMADANAESHDQNPKVHLIPQEYDSLYAFSTVPGYFSWRHSKKGSWFIQALTRVLEEYGETKEIMWMLTRTIHITAFEYETNVKELSTEKQKKQVPQIVSMLTKELYFKRKSTAV